MYPKFEDYWRQLLRKNPEMAEAGTMRISVESFRRSMEQAFQQGQKSGKGERRERSVFDTLGL